MRRWRRGAGALGRAVLWLVALGLGCPPGIPGQPVAPPRGGPGGSPGITGPPAPPAPRSPSAPRAPGAPPAPPGSATATQGLSLLLLSVGAPTGRPEALIVGLEGALLLLHPRRHGPRPHGLARALVAYLAGRDLPPDGARRLADGLERALSPRGAGGELEAALGVVRRALAEAGLGPADIVVIEREIRGLAGRR